MSMSMSSHFTIDDDDEDILIDGDLPVDDHTSGAFELAESLRIVPDNEPDQDASSSIPLGSAVSTDVSSAAAAVPTAAATNVVIPPPKGTPVVPVPPSSTGSDLRYHPEVLDLKLRRKRRTAILGVVGGITGLLVLGPVGGIAAGACAAIGTKAAGKGKERRKMKEIAKQRQVDQAMERAEAAAQGQLTTTTTTRTTRDQHHSAMDNDDDTIETSTSEETPDSSAELTTVRTHL